MKIRMWLCFWVNSTSSGAWTKVKHFKYIKLSWQFSVQNTPVPSKLHLAKFWSAKRGAWESGRHLLLLGNEATPRLSSQRCHMPAVYVLASQASCCSPLIHSPEQGPCLTWRNLFSQDRPLGAGWSFSEAALTFQHQLVNYVLIY